KSLEDLLRNLKSLPEDIQTAVRNNGGGNYNHTMFWNNMAKKGGGKPTGALAKAIDTDLGGFEKLQKDMSDSAINRFATGWAWLSVAGGKLQVTSAPNQDSPVMEGNTPILGLDVWEHAYYLKYRNRRAEYVKAWWNVVNWADVADRYAKAGKG